MTQLNDEHFEVIDRNKAEQFTTTTNLKFLEDRIARL